VVPTTRPGTELASRLVDPELYMTDPFPLYAQLRGDAPVAWNEERGFWALTRYAEVFAVESDAQTFCAGKGILVDEIGSSYESPPTIMHTDPPEHTRYRRLVSPGFHPAVVRALEPFVKARARTLVERLPADSAVDVVAELSVPFPIQIIGHMLGLPEEDWERCYQWSEAVIPGATDWPEERRNELMGEMIETLLAATKARRAEPGRDVLTELAQATIDGDQLSDAELAMFLVQLLVAGNETTRNLISAGLVALSERPDQWQRLRSDATSVPKAVEEMLRWTTPVISFMRTATRRVDLGPVEVGQGEHVLMIFASANRDEAVFGPSASEFDVGRDPNPHIAFGSGRHFCLGAALARLEGRAVLNELLRRFSAIEPAGVVQRSGSMVIAGVRRAELRLVGA
jgi:cytochrome P450